MKEVIVWLLISVSEGSYNQGNALVVEYLPSEPECRSLMNAFGELNRKSALSCVQTTILVK